MMYFLAVWLASGPQGPDEQLKTPPQPTQASVQALIDKTLQDVPEQDRDLVVNIELWQNYDAVESFCDVRSVVDGETLSALAALEAEQKTQ